MTNLNIAIIGAGLAGLTAARKLGPHATVRVFEKSRGLGGRLATRYADPYQFDHGTQHFTAKTPEFQAGIESWLQAGIIAQWNARFVEMERSSIIARRRWDDEFPHYVGAPKMNVIGKHVAQGLDVQTSCRVETIQKQGQQWQLLNEQGEDLGHYDWVICAAPAQQAADLMPDMFAHKAALAQAPLLGCFATMLGFKQPLPLDWDAALIKQADISWISVNSAKPARETDFSLVVHATNAWAEAHMEDAPEAAQAHQLQEISDVIGHDVHKAEHIVTHRWRYANIGKQTGPQAYIDDANQLIACGDWCIHGRVEAAFLSGKAAADHFAA
jgi:renalase